MTAASERREVGERPFRFGVGVLSAPSGGSWVDLARQAEELGFSTLLMPDHLFEQLSPVPALAAAAAVTTTLRIGTHVLGNDYRHPVFAAKEAATLDVLSDGRFELGIGAGWLEADYAAAGMALSRAGVRIERLAEAIHIIKNALSGKTFSFGGRHYQISEYRGFPLPVQRPHPPLIVGGGGRRMLQLAAREADIVSINPNLAKGRYPSAASVEASSWTIAGEGLGRTATARKVAWVRDAAGERMEGIELSCFARCLVTNSRAEAVQRIADAIGMTPDEILDSPHFLVGTPRQIASDLVDRRHRFGISYIIIGQAGFADFGRVIAQVQGR